MAKLLRSIWKGGVLGLRGGFIGGFTLNIILFPLIEIDSLVGLMIFFGVGVIFAVFGPIFGFGIGAILGLVFHYVSADILLWKKMGISILVSSVMKTLIVLYCYIYRYYYGDHNIAGAMVIFYQESAPFNWVIFIMVAVWFGANFHRKSIWIPPILRDKDSA